jgi:Dyp-type peroxidase family
MSTSYPASSTREGPASLHEPHADEKSREADQAHPDVRNIKNGHQEPLLEVDEIQGNIIPGFFKDFETLLFLKIDDVPACKFWLKEIIPLIATAHEVLTFNRLFKTIRFRRKQNTNTVKATWVNIAFSYPALEKLTNGTDGDVTKQDFKDQSFKNGLAKQSELLGDPKNKDDEGHRENWVIGGPNNEADIVLIIQSDDREDLLDQVEQIEDSIYALRRDNKHVGSGVHVLHKDHGANLPGALAGHEHFGFLDGVSQPGIRGVVSGDPTDVLTPRQNPREPKNQGKPGQDLLWPGEFVFGYEYQDPSKDVSEPSNDKTKTAFHQGKLSDAGPIWAKNGSFLVFRRLRQDVEAFHSFLNQQAKVLGHDPTFIGAKIVGRWPSGAPILRSKAADNPPLGNNDCANNDFEFFKADPSSTNPNQTPPDTLPPVGTDDQCKEEAEHFNASPGDPSGKICPAFGHIRKAYPRDDITTHANNIVPDGVQKDSQANDAKESDRSESFTQTHRLLRRGLPYGPVSHSTPDAPVSDEIDRGLLFIAYQTSIEGQFEFVSRNWVNNQNFKDKDVGFDLIIGQNNAEGQNRKRAAKLLFDDQERNLEASKDWVIPTGGGYFFAPSIKALKETLS